MCGIVGMAGEIDFNDRKIFKDLLRVCQLRGLDSTGVIRVNNSGEVNHIKRIGSPEHLLDTKSYDKQIDVPDTKVLIGHCRAKTSGAVTVANAHPFEHKHITGVHNGTLDRDWSLPSRKDFDVDSDWLYWHISKFGIKETIPIIEGAWTLNWWDDNAQTLNFIRNDKRPLFFTHSENMKAMYWASEAWMLSAVSRSIKLWDGGESKTPVYPLPVNMLFSYEIDGKGKTPQEVFTLLQPEEIKSEVRSYSENVTSRGWHGHGNKNKGGEVADPFPKKGGTDKLNDPLKDLIDRNNRANTESQGERGTTNIIGIKSSTNTQKFSEPSTGSTSSLTSQKKTLSLPRTNSGSSQQASNGEQTSESKRLRKILSLRQNGEKLTDHRELARIDFVTDLKSGKEFSIGNIQDRTGGVCTYCTEPFHAKDIFEIFIPEDNKSMKVLCGACALETIGN